jgi:hypothetical protein
MLLGEPDLFLHRKPSFRPEDGISLHMIVNLQWPNRVATIGFRCCTQNSLGFPERRFNQGTSSRKNLRHKGFLTPLGNWAGRETLRISVCTALPKANNSPIRDTTKDYFFFYNRIPGLDQYRPCQFTDQFSCQRSFASCWLRINLGSA